MVSHKVKYTTQCLSYRHDDQLRTNSMHKKPPHSKPPSPAWKNEVADCDLNAKRLHVLRWMQVQVHKFPSTYRYGMHLPRCEQRNPHISNTLVGMDTRYVPASRNKIIIHTQVCFTNERPRKNYFTIFVTYPLEVTPKANLNFKFYVY